MIRLFLLTYIHYIWIFQGRTLSEIFRDEVNIDGILLGLKENELEKCVPVHAMSSGFMLKQMLTPSWAGKKISKSTMDIIKMGAFFSKEMKEMSNQKSCKEID